MDNKARVLQHGIANPSFDAVIGAFPGWYMENFISPDYTACFGGFPLTKDQEGYLTYVSPRLGGEGLVPWLAVREDMGDMVLALFLEPEAWKGKTVQLFSDGVRFEEVVATFEKGEFFFHLLLLLLLCLVRVHAFPITAFVMHTKHKLADNLYLTSHG